MTTTMKGAARLLTILLVAWAVLLPKCSQGQAAGNKGVFNSSSVVAPSQVWIDASAFWTSAMGSTPDLCSIISGIFSTHSSTNYPNGAVIDARGLYYKGTSAGYVGCTGTPFDGLTASPPPTTILLPAATIPATKTWTVPGNVKIVGENNQQTVIRPPSSGWTSGDVDVIDMGSSSFCSMPCSGIAIERLNIDTEDYPNLNGIVNNYAGAGSYVNDVQFYKNGCAGLTIGAPYAANSGPYTNINFVTKTPSSCTAASGGGTGLSSYPLCIDIETQTRGVHGATCIGGSSTHTGYAAIYVNASNNTVEDIHFENFWDGVQIAEVAGSTVGNVVVSNVTGSNNASAPPQNIVHICGGKAASSSGGGAPCTGTGYGTATDVSIFQSTYVNGATGTSVQDDVTGTSIPSPLYGSGDYPGSLAGAYVLGEGIGGGYSRFNVSPAALSTGTGAPPTAPTWGVGSGVTTGATCTTPGALYSSTAGGSNTSVYVCTSVSGSPLWEPIA